MNKIKQISKWISGNKVGTLQCSVVRCNYVKSCFNQITQVCQNYYSNNVNNNHNKVYSSNDYHSTLATALATTPHHHCQELYVKKKKINRKWKWTAQLNGHFGNTHSELSTITIECVQSNNMTIYDIKLVGRPSHMSLKSFSCCDFCCCCLCCLVGEGQTSMRIKLPSAGQFVLTNLSIDALSTSPCDLNANIHLV